MSYSNAFRTISEDPFEDSGNKSDRSTKGIDSGAGGRPLDTEATLHRFKQAIKRDNIAQREYKRLLEEAIQVIECLQKTKANTTPNSKAAHRDENPSLTKILQEIHTIKATITQTQGLLCLQPPSWANFASKSKVAEATLRIQNEEEKREIARLFSEELVKKIGLPEIISPRQMPNGQIKVYFSGKKPKKYWKIRQIGRQS